LISDWRQPDGITDADAGGYNNPAAHNPDNIDTSAGSLMIQETRVQRQRAFPDATARGGARIGDRNVLPPLVDQSPVPASPRGA
jgi:hypothetical protein